jgi:glutamate/tyrosine decarboxylase-like PLP-dependent enzyme
MLESDTLKILRDALQKLDAGFASLPALEAPAPDTQQISAILASAAERLYDNYPYFHPLYAGQMLKPPHPVARLAYSLALWINPNNHALDGGRASSAMEREAVAEIAAMFGWDAHLGHLCGGGTMANLEALWVAGRLAPGKKILVSEQAHYTHTRISSVLQLDCETIRCDARGRMDISALRARLARGDVGTVVATMGTTATGSVDPLFDIVQLRQKYGFRIHADAAYGGYFHLAGNLAEDTRNHFDHIQQVDSIVIDPHKHGLQPYGCGCVLFRDPAIGRLYKHKSPATYFSSTDLHLGEISLECSRPGAAAVALWATQRLLPLQKRGEFANSLGRCREAALAFHQRLAKDDRFLTPFAPELDIIVFAPRAANLDESSILSRKIFDAAARRNLHLAVAELPRAFFGEQWQAAKDSDSSITCLRSVLMKPEHLDWLDRIWAILDEAARECLGR